MVPEARVAAMPPSEASAPGSIGKKRPVIAQGRVELLAGDAGLDHAVQVLGMDGQDPVHAGEVDGDAALQRCHVALERGAGPERDHRHAMRGTAGDDAADILGRGRERHRVGQVQRMVALAAAVLLAQGCRGAEPVAERRRQLRQHPSATPLVPSPPPCLLLPDPATVVRCLQRPVLDDAVGNRESGRWATEAGLGLRPGVALAAAVLGWSATALALDELTFGTNWKAQAEHGGFYQAVADGTYERHGLKVTIRPGGPQVNHSQLLAAGRIDFNMGGNLFEQFNFLQNDVPMVTVAAIFQKEPQVLLAHPDAGIDGFEDLKGKTLLFGNDGRLTFWLWLKQAYGLTDEQIKPYTFNPAPFLADKSSVQQGYVTSEPFAIQQQGGFEPVVLVMADAGYDTYSTTIETSWKLVQEKPDLVQRFVDATAEGWYTYLYGDPVEGQCPDQGRQSRDERRPDRVLAASDEAVRHRRFRRRARRRASGR